MTRVPLLRRLAELILRAGVRLAPGQAREWGKAMRGELQHVEGNWAAVAWALGGAGVLVKQAMIALLLPSRNRQSAPIGNPLSGEAKMHKASLITGGACLAAVLLFFLAPVFRQGFRVSLAQWQSVIHVSQSPWFRQPELESFARRVEKNRDAEGMAFVAARLHDRHESVRLVNEAVRLDPKLIWILGVVGARYSGVPEVPAWVRKLKQWDPGNALPYLILAQREDLTLGLNAMPSAAWQEAMAGAFNSKRIDDYAQQLQALDRIVAQRYKFTDPYLVVERGIAPGLPSYALADSFRYAKLTIASGDKLEASGNTKGTVEKYLNLTHFVHALEAYTSYPLFAGRIMQDVYTHLATAYKKMGNGPQSAYFAGLASTAGHESEQSRLQWRSEMENRHNVFGVTPWNALAVEGSDVAMLGSMCLLLIVLFVVLLKSRTLRPRKLRIGPVVTGLGFLGSVGLLVSSVTLYVAYRPYAAIYSRFLDVGDTSQLTTLRDFLGFTSAPIGTQFYPRPNPLHHGGVVITPYISAHDFTFYFWLAVTVLGVATLAAIGGWQLLKRSHYRTGTAASGEVLGL